ncbi:MAG: RelA/SpoT family protein [Treponema sp.]|uniref:RelA/SpoT family protein n=1 Tax=Treponema sp. TaxID=166 RepID=UPI003FA22CA9
MIQKVENLASLKHFFERYPDYAESENAEDAARISAAWNILLKERMPQAQNGSAETVPTVPASDHAPTDQQAAPITSDDGIPHDIAHSLRMAHSLAALEMDSESIVCALLYSENGSFKLPEDRLRKEFGNTTADILDAAAKFSDVKLYTTGKEHTDTVCKMFFSMVNDLRVMIVQLADRLDKIRYIREYPEDRQRRIAGEIIEIWAPLAQRMGISTVQNELEDLSLKYINREAFDQIKEVVASKKKEREAFLKETEKTLYEAIQKTGIKVTVQSRAKHFWSIYQKMKKRNKAADELFDLLAVRILCNTVNECYTILGLVHTIWKPLEGRFKDYIAMPKANGYKSLHTTVICQGGQTLEIQIRTHEMHEIAERGVASHWLYKKRSKNKTANEQELSFVQQVKSLAKQQRFNNEEFLAELKSDLLSDSIFVFTPGGDIIELPAGATAVDFAYRIHSSIGEKLVAAKADGVIIPLSRPLKNTQKVEIITNPNAHPTHNHYENAHTTRARQKIRAWLQAHENLLNTEKEEKGQQGELQEEAPVRPAKETAEETEKIRRDLEQAQKDPTRNSAVRIRIGNSTNFPVRFAGCCKPTLDAAICGYVANGRGIIIHKKDCRNLKHIPDLENRLIDVKWDVKQSKKPKEAAAKGKSNR